VCSCCCCTKMVELDFARSPAKLEPILPIRANRRNNLSCWNMFASSSLSLYSSPFLSLECDIYWATWPAFVVGQRSSQSGNNEGSPELGPKSASIMMTPATLRPKQQLRAGRPSDWSAANRMTGAKVERKLDWPVGEPFAPGRGRWS